MCFSVWKSQWQQAHTNAHKRKLKHVDRQIEVCNLSMLKL